MANFKTGDKVIYVPCHDTFWNDFDLTGEKLFKFVHLEGSMRGKHGGGTQVMSEGTPVDMNREGAITFNPETGRLQTAAGSTIRHDGPRYFWPAEIVAAYDDGTATITVKHPMGHVTYQMLIPYSKDKKSHTFHKEGD